jgi:uncharacterized damage-inducible protein DinB
MLTYDELKAQPRKLLSLTSLTAEEFDALIEPFDQAWQAERAQAWSEKPRQRKPGGGRKATLKGVEDKLLFILVYFKTYPLQTVQATMFGMSQAQTNEWIHRLTPLLQAALGREQLLPEREPLNLEQTLAECDMLEFLIDGTERRRQRPKDADKQKAYYSGKKRLTP